MHAIALADQMEAAATRSVSSVLLPKAVDQAVALGQAAMGVARLDLMGRNQEVMAVD